MAKHTSLYRRRRSGKTNYHKRLTLLKSGKPIMVIKKSLKNMTVHIVEYNPDGDKSIVQVSSRDLMKMGWPVHRGNLPAAYLTGMLAAKKALEKKVTEVVVDTGMYPSIKGSRIYATIKGAIDAGLKINCDEEKFPTEDRLSGKHIAEHAKALKNDEEKYNRHFSEYIKNKVDPEGLPEMFAKAKSTIEGRK